MKKKNSSKDAQGSGFENLLPFKMFRINDSLKEVNQFVKDFKDATAKPAPVAKGSGLKGNMWSRFLQVKYTQYGGKRSLQSLMRDPAIKAEYAAKYKK